MTPRVLQGVLTLVFASSTGCIATWRRAEVEARLLREHYATAGAPAATAQVRALWERLEWPHQLGCLSVKEPCRAPSTEGSFCFHWGEEHACFRVSAGGDGTRLERTDASHAHATERWLYEALDPAFAATHEVAAHVADAEVHAEETPPRDANSFWAAVRGVAQLPLATVGLQVQGGYRRWLEHYVLFSVGGGYERTFTRARGFDEPRDAALVTARLELSAWDGLASKRANLPVLGAYFGLTGVLGITPQASWSTRAYVGVSAIVPFSVELGYSLSALNNATVGQFYVAAGFGI